MIGIVLVILALLSPFLFPWPAVAILALVASIFLPPLALVVGVLMDTLYWTSGPAPLATLIGLAGTLIAYIVQHVLKTRIMGA